MKGRFCFISSVRPGRAKQQSELIVAHLGKSSLALATHGHQMFWMEGGGKGDGEQANILKPNNLSFVFCAIVLGRARMEGKSLAAFLMRSGPSWLNGMPCFLFLPRETHTHTHNPIPVKGYFYNYQ